MKKLLVLFSATVVFAATSCDKKSSTITAPTTPPNLTKTATLVGGLIGPTHYFDPGPKFCVDVNVDCTRFGPEISATDIINLNSAIASGATAVGTFFNNPDVSGDFYPSLTVVEGKDLQSGKYTLLQVPSAPTLTYVIGNAATLSLTSYEFAYQQ